MVEVQWWEDIMVVEMECRKVKVHCMMVEAH